MSIEAVSSQIKENRIVSLDRLVPHPRNFRSHPEEQIQSLILSLQRFGQGRSIVIQDSPEHLLIVAGHGIVEAAQRLNWTELRADILPAHWSPSQIDGYLIADNLLSQQASDEESLLAALLQEQVDAGFDLVALGSDEETLRQMLEAISQATPDEWTDALGDLPDGDKSPFQQMTFTLTNEQADMVKEALDLALEDKDNFGETGNQNSNGNALAYIVKFFLEMDKGEDNAA